jgi:hypothetical protein
MTKRLDDIIEEETNRYRRERVELSDVAEARDPMFDRVGSFVAYQNHFYIISRVTLNPTRIHLFSLEDRSLSEISAEDAKQLLFDFKYQKIDIHTLPNFTLYENLRRCKLIYSARIPEQLLTYSESKLIELCELHFEKDFSCESFDASIAKIFITRNRVSLQVALSGVDQNYLELYWKYGMTQNLGILVDLQLCHARAQIPTLLQRFEERIIINVNEEIVFSFQLEEVQV